MLVTTSAPIIEETSNASGDKKKKGNFRKKAGEKFKQGYTSLKEAGALPVIENLLQLNTGSGTNIPDENSLPPMSKPEDTPPKKMSTTTKVVIGVLIVGAIAGAYYYFNKSAKGAKKSK